MINIMIIKITITINITMPLKIMVMVIGHCEQLLPLLDLCVSSLRRGHANLRCIVPKFNG